MKVLVSYLNDHLAGSVAAIELLDHLIKEQTSQRLERFLVDLRDDVHADQEVLQNLIGKLDLEESTARKLGGWIVEKTGRAKITLSGDSAGGLGLLQALEALALGITGKNFSGVRWARSKRSCRRCKASIYHDWNNVPRTNSSEWRKNGCVSRVKHLQAKKRPRIEKN